MISKQENHKEDSVILENKNVICMGEKPSTEGQINYEKYLQRIHDINILKFLTNNQRVTTEQTSEQMIQTFRYVYVCVYACIY